MCEKVNDNKHLHYYFVCDVVAPYKEKEKTISLSLLYTLYK